MHRQKLEKLEAFDTLTVYSFLEITIDESELRDKRKKEK